MKPHVDFPRSREARFVLLFALLAAFAAAPIRLTAQPGAKPFAETVQEMEDRYAGLPVRGEVKRWKRARYWTERHLDASGIPVNPMAANAEAAARWAGWGGASGGNWTSMGPYNTESFGNAQEGIGRVNCIAFESATTWYVGTAGGGLWRTENAATWVPGLPYPWECLTDDLPALAISGIAVDPLDPNNLWILTGDGDGGGFAGGLASFGVGEVPGVGILRSTDRGATWDSTGFVWNRTQLQAGFKLAVDPNNPAVQFACASDGLHRTTDGWATFTTLLSNPVYDIEFHPTDPNTVYASGEARFYRSTDGGLSFSNQTANLAPVSDVQRVALAVTPAQPDLIYLVAARASNGGLASFQYSIDGGDNWVQTLDNSFNILAREDPTTTSNGQGNYDLAIWADPTNPARVFVGGVDLWKSTTGGLLWTISADDQEDAPEFIHADVHALEYNPFSGWLLAGTDGGIWSSTDIGATWSEKGQGLAITQFYHAYAFLHPLFGLIELGGGTQDNGTLASYNLPFDYEHAKGADGFRAYRGTPDDRPVRFVSTQNGRLYRQDLPDPESGPFGWFSGEEEITPDDQLDGSGSGLGRWDTPYETGPGNFMELVAGYDALYWNADGDHDWTRMPLIHPRTSYSGNQSIVETHWAPFNNNHLYFAVNDGNRRDLWSCEAFVLAKITGNLSTAFCRQVDIDSLTGDNQLVTHILTNPFNSDEVWLTMAGYSDSNKVWYNPDIDSSGSWINISYNLPNVPVHSIVYDLDGVYAGTDIGVFYLQHGESTWMYFSDGLPTVPVMEVHIGVSALFGRKLYVATYGRGMWTSDLAPTIRRTRWYVDDDAAGLDNGSSWTNAFPTLAEALGVALPGDSIWVADGTYRPSSTGSREASFETGHAQIKVYGGFAGTENSLGERDSTTTAVTILSGDIGVLGDSTDNSYHIWRMSGANAGLLLDRLVIEEGMANGSASNSQGGGVFFSNSNAQGGKPIFRDVVFRRNGASLDGAAVYVEDVLQNDAPIYFVDCAFEHNRAYALGSRGGAVYATTRAGSTTGGSASVDFDGCVFHANTALSGSAVYLNAANGGTANVPFNNCQFSGAYWDGGYGNLHNGLGIYLDLRYGGSSRLSIDSSAFTDQVSGGSGGAIYVPHNPDGVLDLLVRNSQFQNLGSASSGGVIHVQANQAGSQVDMAVEDCHFLDNASGYGGALQLDLGGGNNTLRFARSAFTGNQSTAFGGAVNISMLGVGQLQFDMDTVLFEDNHSTSTGGAMRVFLASGAFSTARFNGVDWVGNSGNYAGALDVLASGAISTWTLDGGGFHGNSSLNSAGALQANGAGTGGMLWTMRNMALDSNSAIGSGGAMYMTNSSLTLQDVSFTGNGFNSSLAGAVNFGGALFLENRFWNQDLTLRFARSAFHGNAAHTHGGSVAIRSDAPGSVRLILDTVLAQGNHSDDLGGVLHTYGSGTMRIEGTDSRFASNSADDQGGAWYLSKSGTDSLEVGGQRWTFDQNSSVNGGGAVYLYADGPLFFEPVDTRWTNNTSVLDGGALYTHPYIGDTAKVLLDRAWLTGNSAGRNGGAVYAGAGSSSGHVRMTLRNAVVADNEAIVEGGGLWTGGTFPGATAHMDLDFVSAYGNRAAAGAFASLHDVGTTGQTQLHIRNSLIGESPYENTAALFAVDAASSGSAAYSWIEGGLPGGFTDAGGLLAEDPRWVYPEDPAGPDGLPATMDDGLFLALSSPAISGADPIAPIAHDLLGQFRTPGFVDAGAYEGGSAACSVDFPPTGLNAVPVGGKMRLSWKPVPNTSACQVRGRPLGTTSFATVNAIGTETAGQNIPGSVLTPGLSYEWKVRCACSTAPVLSTDFSELDTFTVPLVRQLDLATDWHLQPNPVQAGGILQVHVDGPRALDGRAWRLLNALGQEQSTWTPTAFPASLPLPAGLSAGLYWLVSPSGESKPVAVQR